MTNEACKAPEYDGDPNNRFAQLRTPLLAAAIKQASDRDFAEDAVQITMERVFKKFPVLGAWPPERLKAYSRKVLRNVIRDEYRRMGRQRAILMAPESLPEHHSNLGIPEAAYEEVRAEIHRFVEELPKRQREVVELCILKQMPRSEVAEKMGVSEETVQRYMTAAFKRLRTMNASSEEVTA